MGAPLHRLLARPVDNRCIHDTHWPSANRLWQLLAKHLREYLL